MAGIIYYFLYIAVLDFKNKKIAVVIYCKPLYPEGGYLQKDFAYFLTVAVQCVRNCKDTDMIAEQNNSMAEI